MTADEAHMRAALAIAREGLGRVWPNPSVGCVIVSAAGAVVGRGRTHDGGRPHAEVVALREAAGAAEGATVYVTLEPCAHHGKSPPCADALVRARVGRCVVALRDPDPRVDGGGLARLRAAGVDVEVGLLEAEAAELNSGFLHRIRAGAPQLFDLAEPGLDATLARSPVPPTAAVQDPRPLIHLGVDDRVVGWYGVAPHADQGAALDELGSASLDELLARLGALGLTRLGATPELRARLEAHGAT